MERLHSTNLVRESRLFADVTCRPDRFDLAITQRARRIENDKLRVDTGGECHGTIRADTGVAFERVFYVAKDVLDERENDRGRTVQGRILERTIQWRCWNPGSPAEADCEAGEVDPFDLEIAQRGSRCRGL